MALLATAWAWLSTLSRVWAAMPGPVRAAVLIALAAGIGYWRGMSAEATRCEARIAASITAAQALDQSFAQVRKIERATQVAGETVRALETESEIKGYVEELSKRTIAGCAVGADADRVNAGLGLQPDEGGLPAPGPAAARGRRDRAHPGPVPPRKGQ